MIYLDNASTTKPSKEAISAMMPFLENDYGNPSNLYAFGQKAKDAIDDARAKIAKCIGAESKEIYFTSGGSESNNQAINSAAQIGARKGKKHIISSQIEHHSVLNTLQKLERNGFEVTYLPVYSDGIVRTSDLEKAIRPDTCLVTIMLANNEIGTIQPIAEIGKICHEKKIIFHTDAVQGAGHMEIDVNALNVDMLSISAHKFHGLKGNGVLYCRKTTPLMKFIEGGTQEKNKRAGTENVAGIVAMATALEIACKDMKKNNAKMKKLRDKLFASLSKIPHSAINGSTSHRLDNNFNMCFEGIEGESLLLLLDDKGICASSGSACTSGSLDPSHVLLAIGRPHEVAHGSLRLSLSAYSTQEDVDAAIREVPKIVEYLRKISPVWDELEKGERKHVI